MTRFGSGRQHDPLVFMQIGKFSVLFVVGAGAVCACAAAVSIKSDSMILLIVHLCVLLEIFDRLLRRRARAHRVA